MLSQLCHCVQWKRSVQYMTNSGVSDFVEFGPGKVLSGLVKRIDQGVEVTSVNDIASIGNLAETTVT